MNKYVQYIIIPTENKNKISGYLDNIRSLENQFRERKGLTDFKLNYHIAYYMYKNIWYTVIVAKGISMDFYPTDEEEKRTGYFNKLQFNFQFSKSLLDFVFSHFNCTFECMYFRYNIEAFFQIQLEGHILFKDVNALNNILKIFKEKKNMVPCRVDYYNSETFKTQNSHL